VILTMNNIIRLGIAGACSRGSAFKAACDALADRVTVQAVCDTNEADLPAAAERLGAGEQYTDYEAMIDNGNLDAVIIGTPMPLHVPQAVAALDHGISVLSEVTAGVSIDECRVLVRACRRSDAVYMMGENYTYLRSNIAVREMVRRGMFGEVYYAEGEYIHELKKLNELTPWRRKWQTGVNGVTYGTHSLGPILQWFHGQRVVAVCGAGSGHHYRDPRGDEYENEDCCLMLCRLSGGGLATIRVDMLSNRPHNMAGYSLQGTDGCYESARGLTDKDKIWLRARDPDGGPGASSHDFTYQWEALESFDGRYLPNWYKAGMEAAREAGHGGGDYFEILDFIEAIAGCRPCPIGIHEAMDMTLPGLVSQRSVRQGGSWLPVPDSREWTDV